MTLYVFLDFLRTYVVIRNRIGIIKKLINLKLNGWKLNTDKSPKKKGIKYKKAGVIVMGIIPDNKHQLNIFEKEDPKHNVIMKTLDFIAKKEGVSKIKLASQDLKKIWKI